MSTSKKGRTPKDVDAGPPGAGAAPSRLVCPNGHSETFRLGRGTTTLLGGGLTRVDCEGNIVETYNPNTITQEYTCDVCGVTFSRSHEIGWRRYG